MAKTKADYYKKQLAELLGLEVPKAQVKIPKKQIMAIEELDTQKIREAEGVAFFLKAPELFVARECVWCGTEFLVSRRNIAYCSWEHLQKGLNREGIRWDKDKGFEAIVHDYFEDNEPIWIRRLDQIREILNDFEPMLRKYEVLTSIPETPETSEYISPYEPDYQPDPEWIG
jgi:hypothetical protein